MTLWAIIPVKPLTSAKSRLAQALTPEQRAALAERLFRGVVSAARAAPEVNGVLVISRDPRALAIARDLGAHTVQESGQPELNSALMRATQVVQGWHGGAVLILPADLPLIAAEDVSGMARMGMDKWSVVIATDRAEDGTNAMLVRPPGLFPYAYGVGSFGRHIHAAREAGAAVKRYHSDRLTLDIDLPADLEAYQQATGENLITGETTPASSTSGA